MDFIHIAFSLSTLIFLEIILGIDNLVFVAIASSRMPTEKQAKARNIGLSFALITRLLLLSVATWIATLTNPLMTIQGFALSARDCLLGFGGIFLLYKGTQEIHQEISHLHEDVLSNRIESTLIKVVSQIAVLDIIFSLDSVITAVAMTPHFWIMATAISIAMIIMIFASHPLSRFIDNNPSIKMLAMSFILMIGMVLLADSFHLAIPRGYIYFSITFSLFVETLNIVKRNRRLKSLK